MICPRCETSVLEEKERDGILVDGCPSCRGVWLDRGELEKLIQRSLAEIERVEGVGAAASRDDGRRPLDRRDDDRRIDDRRLDDRRDDDRRFDDRRDDDRRWRRDDDDDDDRYDRHPRRKRGFLESLGDIFD
jgi:Zn-finger nucleic acid-binding protein